MIKISLISKKYKKEINKTYNDHRFYFIACLITAVAGIVVLIIGFIQSWLLLFIGIGITLPSWYFTKLFYGNMKKEKKKNDELLENLDKLSGFNDILLESKNEEIKLKTIAIIEDLAINSTLASDAEVKKAVLNIRKMTISIPDKDKKLINRAERAMKVIAAKHGFDDVNIFVKDFKAKESTSIYEHEKAKMLQILEEAVEDMEKNVGSLQDMLTKVSLNKIAEVGADARRLLPEKAKEIVEIVKSFMLNDKDDDIRLNAMFATAAIGGREVIPDLVRVSQKDRNATNRYGTGLEILKLDKIDGVMALCDIASNDIDETIKKGATGEILELSRRAGMEVQDFIDQYAEEDRQRKKKHAYPTILSVLKQIRPDVSVSLDRISEIGNVNKKDAEEVIINLLKDNPNIGEYLELEQVFIKKEGIENEINELLKSFESMSEKKL